MFSNLLSLGKADRWTTEGGEAVIGEAAAVVDKARELADIDTNMRVSSLHSPSDVLLQHRLHLHVEAAAGCFWGDVGAVECGDYQL